MGRHSSTSVVVQVPARPDHVHVLRAVVSSVAARLNLPFDAIEDLKIAVNEACAHLLDASNGSIVRLALTAWSGGLEIETSVDDPHAVWPPDGFEGSMTWHVLTALTDDASFEQDGDPILRFTKRALGQGS